MRQALSPFPAQSAGDGQVFELELPIPPSLNAMFANARGKGRVKTREYRMWIKHAKWDVWLATKGQHKTIEGPFDVEIECDRPNMRRDLDNIIKPLLDILVSEDVVTDDRYVKRITASWGEKKRVDECRARIRVITDSAAGGCVTNNQ